MHMPRLKRGLNFSWSRAALVLLWMGLLTACAASSIEAVPAAPAPTAMTEEARCAAGGGTWDKRNFKLADGYCAKGTPAQCQASGGNWQRVCMMGTLACVQPYADANKTCGSGADCQGKRCLQAAEARGNSQSQTGRCLPNNNPCYFGINLENGQPVPTAVAD
jgi:hypothetical protein